jgi:hypothetical protein
VPLGEARVRLAHRLAPLGGVAGGEGGERAAVPRQERHVHRPPVGVQRAGELAERLRRVAEAVHEERGAPGVAGSASGSAPTITPSAPKRKRCARVRS